MKKINIFLMMLAACFMMACSKTEPTYETRPENPALPVISIEGQEDLFQNGISAQVEGEISFKFHVEAEAGLTELLLNDESVRKFPYGQLTQSFTYNFKMPDIPEISLEFAICDEAGQKTVLSPIKVTAKGRIPDNFLLADLGGEFIENQTDPLPMHQPASQIQKKFYITSDVENFNHAYVRMLWDSANGAIDKTFSFAQQIPGREDKALKITKQGVALNMQIRFDEPIPSVLIEKIASGDRKLVMDLYIDSDEVPANNNFEVYYASFNKYKNDKSGMLKKVISQWTFSQADLKKWTQAEFDLTQIGNTGNSDFATSSDIDLLVIKPTMQSLHGPYYIKNIRIVDVKSL